MTPRPARYPGNRAQPCQGCGSTRTRLTLRPRGRAEPILACLQTKNCDRRVREAARVTP